VNWWYVGTMVLLFWASNLLFYQAGRSMSDKERSDYE
jgi:hypothetical protein